MNACCCYFISPSEWLWEMARYIWLPSATFEMMLWKPLTLKTTETLWDKPLTWCCALTHIAGNAFGSLATRLCFWKLVHKRCQFALLSFGLLIVICKLKSLIKAKKINKNKSRLLDEEQFCHKKTCCFLISSHLWDAECCRSRSTQISQHSDSDSRGKPLKSPLQSLLPSFSHPLIPYTELGKKNAISSAPSTWVTLATNYLTANMFYRQ